MIEKRPRQPFPEISLGTEFFPFTPGAYHRGEYGDVDAIQSAVSLRLPVGEGVLSVKVELHLQDIYWGAKGLEIVPFHPEEGYIINEDDFNLESRRVKLLTHVRRLHRDERHPLVLAVFIEKENLQRSRLVDISRQGEDLFVGGRATPLRSLRCVLNAKGVYVSQKRNRLLLWGDDLFSGYEFGDFFPADCGPLAADSEMTWFSSYTLWAGSGHRLFFHDNKEEIAQIKARFITDPLPPVSSEDTPKV